MTIERWRFWSSKHNRRNIIFLQNRLWSKNSKYEEYRYSRLSYLVFWISCPINKLPEEGDRKKYCPDKSLNCEVTNSHILLLPMHSGTVVRLMQLEYTGPGERVFSLLSLEINKLLLELRRKEGVGIKCGAFAPKKPSPAGVLYIFPLVI